MIVYMWGRDGSQWQRNPKEGEENLLCVSQTFLNSGTISLEVKRDFFIWNTRTIVRRLDKWWRLGEEKSDLRATASRWLIWSRSFTHLDLDVQCNMACTVFQLWCSLGLEVLWGFGEAGKINEDITWTFKVLWLPLSVSHSWLVIKFPNQRGLNVYLQAQQERRGWGDIVLCHNKS